MNDNVTGSFDGIDYETHLELQDDGKWRFDLTLTEHHAGTPGFATRDKAIEGGRDAAASIIKAYHRARPK